MGIKLSKENEIEDKNNNGNESALESFITIYPNKIYNKLPIATSNEVHHYFPSNFPIFPVLNSIYIAKCNKTWKMICTANTEKMKGYGKQGIILFYDEFFHRLFQRDSSMEEVFPSIKLRSDVLIKAMTFMLKTSVETHDKIANRCHHLGYRHRTINKIRPHHFAVYVSTCIEIIMYWLGNSATPDAGEAWSNLMGYYLKHLLQSYLYKKTDRTEWAQNTLVDTSDGNNVPKKSIE